MEVLSTSHGLGDVRFIALALEPNLRRQAKQFISLLTQQGHEVPRSDGLRKSVWATATLEPFQGETAHWVWGRIIGVFGGRPAGEKSCPSV